MPEPVPHKELSVLIGTLNCFALEQIHPFKKTKELKQSRQKFTAAWPGGQLEHWTCSPEVPGSNLLPCYLKQ